jgi:hypothetical protein
MNCYDISRKRNVIIGDNVPERPRNDQTTTDQVFYCLKRNMQATVTYSVITFATK